MGLVLLLYSPRIVSSYDYSSVYDLSEIKDQILSIQKSIEKQNDKEKAYRKKMKKQIDRQTILLNSILKNQVIQMKQMSQSQKKMEHLNTDVQLLKRIEELSWDALQTLVVPYTRFSIDKEMEEARKTFDKESASVVRKNVTEASKSIESKTFDLHTEAPEWLKAVNSLDHSNVTTASEKRTVIYDALQLDKTKQKTSKSLHRTDKNTCFLKAEPFQYPEMEDLLAAFCHAHTEYRDHQWFVGLYEHMEEGTGKVSSEYSTKKNKVILCPKDYIIDPDDKTNGFFAGDCVAQCQSFERFNATIVQTRDQAQLDFFSKMIRKMHDIEDKEYWENPSVWYWIGATYNSKKGPREDNIFWLNDVHRRRLNVEEEPITNGQFQPWAPRFPKYLKRRRNTMLTISNVLKYKWGDLPSIKRYHNRAGCCCEVYP